ncbi:hypothetical protein [Pseudoalteromonas sp. OF7H-1]|uniref:hypothetical protein n=1 Tax=Pseudoalteromonas sp. OF7H-1 TaxID=2917755 RepID=UPI001EF40ED9|nr:hypothetical protein [Pseudoalteromonas sp. OF7H-1]MCG7538012.1 hypothetical protein [Pseudoalteromonas sp. OF7H-1]
MAEKIMYRDVEGLFIPTSEWERFKCDLEALNRRAHDSEKQLEIVQGQAKFKLKKLARIIERKDKQIDELNKKFEMRK